VQCDEFLKLKFTNIPLINLRMDFEETYTFVFSSEVESSIKPPIEPIQIPLLIWFGNTFGPHPPVYRVGIEVKILCQFIDGKKIAHL
jgi:hypothetical protein